MNNLVKLICCSFLLLSIACTQKEKEADNEIVIVDVLKEYPEKKMLLQDIADVEYIRMETTDDLLWQGRQANAFTDQYIINHHFKSGDVLFFDKTGKAIKKINRQGGSGEEYSAYSNFLLDEDNKELYFDDRYKKKIFVYDLNGVFKRVLEYAPDKRYEDLRNFDANRLIAYNNLLKEDEINSYLIISKSTGEIEHEFIIPQTGRKLSNRQRIQDGENVMIYSIQTLPLTAVSPDFILADISNDTIFSMNKSMELYPIAIQQPSRPTMDPERFLFYAFDCYDYLFFEVVEKKFEGEGMNVKVKSWDLVYDKKESKLFQQNIYNGDFTSEKKISISTQMTQFSDANKNVFLQVLNAADLIEANENNQLKDKLKEIAKDLDEEDNPVLLVARFK